MSAGFSERFHTSADGMRNLNDLLDPSGAGWTLRDAIAINDAGQIVGYGTSPPGAQHGFLLTPVPEPPTLALVALALALLTLWQSYKQKTFLRGSNGDNQWYSGAHDAG
jgi:probable HAF family extracellular repeat protein